MAFSFATPVQPTFGLSTQARPVGFGGTFSSPATSAAPLGFGNYGGSTFNTAQTTPFGSSAPFGLPATSCPSTTSFGTSGFGAFGTAAPNNNAPTAFGSGFGSTPAATANTGGGLFGSAPGAASKPTLFGTPQPTSAGLFPTPAIASSGSFSTFTTPAQAPTAFGVGTTTTTSAAPNMFGGGAPSSNLFGSFGATTSAPTNTLFGTGTTTNTFGTSGGFGSTSGGGLFGATPAGTAGAAPMFGGGFGTTTNTTSAFGGFGTGGTSTFGTGSNLFGAKPQQAQAPTASIKNQQVITSVYALNVYNDERDEILKKWNMLQACWGTGKGHFHATAPAVEYTPENPFFRFKTMGYNVIPDLENAEGVIKLIFNKKHSELKNQIEVLKNGMSGILGNKPNLTVEITHIKSLSDTVTEVRMVVSEKSVTGFNRKIAATDLAAFLNQPTQKQQLSSVGVTQITPYTTPTRTDVEDYLKAPPPGTETHMWKAAITDNPNRKKYLPVSVNGFAELRARMVNQEHTTGLHRAFFEKVNRDIIELKTKHAASIAVITELKQKFMEQQHRILRILVKQECTRNPGVIIQPAEEILRGRLELIHAQLNVPQQFKGQINELLSHVTMIEGERRQVDQNYRIDAEAHEQIKQFLAMEQNGISHLVNMINSDLQSIKIINDGIKQIAMNPNPTGHPN